MLRAITLECFPFFPTLCLYVYYQLVSCVPTPALDAKQSYSEINEILTVPDVHSPVSGGCPPLLSLLQVFCVEKLLTLNQLCCESQF